MRRRGWTSAPAGAVLLTLAAAAGAPAAAQSNAPTAPNARATPRQAADYRVEDVALPAGMDPQIGGIDFLPNGRLVAAFHSGDVFTYDPRARRWAKFAEGLFEPLGVLAEPDGRVLVAQKPELTRLADTDGDGRADRYDVVTDAFGFGGNYHEFAFGPARDAAGNLYLALNLASSLAGILDEVRGEIRAGGMTREELRRPKFTNLMSSPVPYRGWVLQVTPDGRTLPFAAGLRSPNGIVVDPRGRLLVNDNQGDWVGTSRMYHVRAGGFYGHPASLLWKEGWTRDPRSVGAAELDAMRTREAVAFPHESMAKSPTQPVVVPAAGWGAFAGQLLVGEMNEPRILRVMLEEVGGAVQGAVVPLLDGASLGGGNNRLAFAPDGSLWVGKIHLKWVGGTGLKRIRAPAALPMDVQAMTLTARGFDLAFTRPVNAGLAANRDMLRVRRYYYQYHQQYGSPQTDTATVAVTGAVLSQDGRRVRVDLAELRPGYVYELDLAGLRAADGTPVRNPVVAYTLNRLLDGTRPTPGLEVVRANSAAAAGRPSAAPPPPPHE